MAYTRAQIIEKVVVKMDELTPFDEGLILSDGNEGVMPIRQYIESVLDEVVRKHLGLCPIHKIPSTCIGTLDAPTGTTVMTFAKPATFIKVHTIKFDTWKRAVHKAITPVDDLFKLQSNNYTMGKPSKPVVVELASTLEAYSIISGDAITGTFSYVQSVVAETITDDQTLDMMAWLCAYMVLSIMGEQSAKIAFENYKLSLND